jgi:glycosyltransferase involved in cell wall biosynthesis
MPPAVVEGNFSVANGFDLRRQSDLPNASLPKVPGINVLLLAPPLGRAGGIQRYTAMLERALRELLNINKVRCVAIEDDSSGPTRRHLSFWTKLHFVAQALRLNSQCRPDLIICTHLSTAPVGWLLARLNRGSYWVVVHGIEAWKRLPYLKHMALCHADRVLTTSCFNREQVMKSQKLTPERLLNLPCALDDHLLNIAPARDQQHRTGDRPLVLSVGRLSASERYKGHDLVLKALPSVIEQVPELRYVIVGDGDDRPRLEGLACKLGLRTHVSFLGEITDAELASLYRTSQVFVLPARTVLHGAEPKGEGFGIVYLEAMAFGVPVIGPKYGAPAEIIEGHGLLIDPENASELSEALLRLVNAPEEAACMGEAARKWVQREYSYSSFRERLRTILATSLNHD